MRTRLSSTGLGIALPHPAVLTAAVAVVILFDLPSAFSTMLGYSVLSDREFWLRDLPPLLAMPYALTNSYVLVLGIPISLCLRMAERLPLAFLPVMTCHGCSPHRVVRDLLREAVLHALLFWLATTGIVAIAMHFCCTGSYDPSYLDTLAQAGADLSPLPHAVLISLVLCAETLIEALGLALVVAGIRIISANGAAPIVVLLAMVLARDVVAPLALTFAPASLQESAMSIIGLLEPDSYNELSATLSHAAAFSLACLTAGGALAVACLCAPRACTKGGRW